MNSWARRDVPDGTDLLMRRNASSVALSQRRGGCCHAAATLLPLRHGGCHAQGGITNGVCISRRSSGLRSARCHTRPLRILPETRPSLLFERSFLPASRRSGRTICLACASQLSACCGHGVVLIRRGKRPCSCASQRLMSVTLSGTVKVACLSRLRA